MSRDKREIDRLHRRNQIIEQQAQQLEDQISVHELDLVRLDTLPDDVRDDGWREAYSHIEQQIAVLRTAIDATLSASNTK